LGKIKRKKVFDSLKGINFLSQGVHQDEKIKPEETDRLGEEKNRINLGRREKDEVLKEKKFT
jgi:hypothetical protein